MGSILPARIVSALSVGLYGMFIAIVFPSLRKNKVLAWLIPAAMVLSYTCARLPYISNLSSGTRVIILTVLLSSVAAKFFPVDEEKEESHAD